MADLVVLKDYLELAGGVASSVGVPIKLHDNGDGTWTEGGGAGGGATTVADGADVAEGSTADAAVAAGATGTISAKLRSISRDVVPIGAVADAVVAAGATGSLSAKLRRLTTDLGALLLQLPATLGAKTSALSLSVAPATDYALPAATNATSTAYEKSHILAATPARLFSLQGYNSGVDQFIQIHDSATLPADAAVPVITVFVSSQSPFAWDFGQRGRSFAAGIVVCNSSTGPTKTLGATADCWFDGQVI